MIYNDDVQIPMLGCPISFVRDKSEALYPIAAKYLPKLPASTYVQIRISQDLYALNNLTLLMKDLVSGQIIKTIAMTRHQLSPTYSYADGTVTTDDIAGTQIVYFELAGIDGVLYADSRPYLINPFNLTRMVEIEYTHDENDFNTVFSDLDSNGDPVGDPHVFNIMVEGGFKPFDVDMRDEAEDYQEQDFENKMVFALPYSVEKITFGGANGIPYWLYKRLGYIFSCSILMINGVTYKRANGAKLEKEIVGTTGMVFASIELQPFTDFSENHVNPPQAGDFNIDFNFDFNIYQ